MTLVLQNDAGVVRQLRQLNIIGFTGLCLTMYIYIDIFMLH